MREEDGVGLAAPGPVFVDSSGRRGTLVRRICWALGLVMAAYVAVVLVALVGPPGLSRLAIPGLGPVLPGAAAPALLAPTGRHGTPASVLSPRPSLGPGLANPSPAAAPATGTRRPTATPSPSPRASVAASPTPRQTPSNAASGRPTNAPISPGPRSSQTPPGQTSPHPTPRSTHARAASPAPSPTL